MSSTKWSKKGFAGVLATTSLSLIVAACGGGGGSSTAGGTTTNEYAGPGSKWEFDLASDGTFAIEHRPDISSAVDYTVAGTHESLASGFLKLTVTGGTGADAPTAGDTAWALEVPGYALMVKPIDDTSNQVISMVSAGDCPTSDINANWVLVKKDVGSLADDAGRDFYGTFNYDVVGNSPTLPNKYALEGFTAVGTGSINPGTVTCADGILNIPDAVMYLTSNGGAIVHTTSGTAGDETDDQFIFGLGQKAITAVANLDGDYAGMLFDDSMADGTKINPVSFSCTGGTCIGALVTDIVTGAVSSDTVTVVLGSADMPSNGFITGTINDGGSTPGNLACMADIDANDSGKAIVSCVGQSPGDNENMFNVLFVSKS